MKSLNEQIEFIDKKLLPVYNIKNIKDYMTIIYANNLNNMDKLNGIIDEFRKIFPVKNFNLHKTEYKIKSSEQSFLFLKKILETSCIYFESGIIQNKKYLRLIPENIILKKYIENMENNSEIRSINYNYNLLTAETKLNQISNKFNQTDLQNNIKKQLVSEYILFPKNIVTSEHYEINLNNNMFSGKNIKNIKLYFISGIDMNNNDIYSKEHINSINNSHKTVKLIINDDIIKTKFNNNSLLDNDIIIITDLLQYTKFKILLLRDENLINLDNILIKIVVTHVEFYTEFYKKLNLNCLLEQELCVNNIKYDTAIHNGTFNIKNLCQINRLEYIKSQYDVLGETGNINDLKYYNIYSSNSSNTNISLTILVHDFSIDMVYEPPKTYSFGENYYINVSNNISENNFIIPKYGDLIYEICIYTKYLINNIDKFYLTIDSENNKYDLNLEYIGVAPEGFLKYKVKNINKHKVINACSAKVQNLIIQMKGNKMTNYFENSKVSIGYNLCQTQIRKKLFELGTIIDLQAINLKS